MTSFGGKQDSTIAKQQQQLQQLYFSIPISKYGMTDIIITNNEQTKITQRKYILRKEYYKLITITGFIIVIRSFFHGLINKASNQSTYIWINITGKK